MAMSKYRKAMRLAKELDIPKREAQELLRNAGWDMDKARLAYKLRGVDITAVVETMRKALEELKNVDWTDIFQKIGESVSEIIPAVAEGISETLKAVLEGKKEVEDGTERIPFEVYQGEHENDLHSVP